MKKVLGLILASLLVVTFVSGCTPKKEETPVTPEKPATETPATPEAPATTDGATTPANAADGTYKAEGTADSFGWKPFVEVEIKGAKITSVNFDYDNAGKLKSEDKDYAAQMEPVAKTSPDKFIPEYESKLVETQDISKVDTIAGATQSYGDFTTLVKQALTEAESK